MLRCTLYAIRYTLYAIRYTLYATRCTLFGTHYTLDANTLYALRYTLYAIRCKQPLGQIVPKTSSGTNRSTKQKMSQQILPTKPSQKKRAGRAPRLAAQCARPPAGRQASRPNIGLPTRSSPCQLCCKRFAYPSEATSCRPKNA